MTTTPMNKTPQDNPLQTARDALLCVQEALAAFRDGVPYVHPTHGQLSLEEVKYVLVDPALEILR